MEALTLGVAIALLAVLAAEFVNGWTDAPNAIATVVSTGVMTPRNAIIMAVVMNTVGAMAGTAVATTVGKGIVTPAALTIPAITATMLAIIAWGTLGGKDRDAGQQVARAARRPCGRRIRGRRLGCAAVGRMAESRHRHGLLDRPRISRRLSHRQTRSSSWRRALHRTAPSATSTTRKWFPRLSWRSIMA